MSYGLNKVTIIGNLGNAKLLARVDLAYVVGLEARGLSPHARRVVESGQVEVCEWTNYALACRLHAAAMGVPFMPTYSTMGSDLLVKNGNLREFNSPVNEEKLIAVRALRPDVAIIHVQRADEYGNSHLWGWLGEKEYSYDFNKRRP